MRAEDRIDILDSQATAGNESMPFDNLRVEALQAIALLRESDKILTVHAYTCKWTMGGDFCSCGMTKWQKAKRIFLEGGDES